MIGEEDEEGGWFLNKEDEGMAGGSSSRGKQDQEEMLDMESMEVSVD